MERKNWLEQRQKGISVTDIAELAGVSRQTVHKWLRRAAEYGVGSGLEDRSRARLTQERFDGSSMDELIALRRKHPTWGARALVLHIAKRRPHVELPAASTLHDRLKIEGLVAPRRRLKRYGPLYRPGDTTPTEPNDRWTIDFKGHFRMRDGKVCYPLTVRDAATRMVLAIVGGGDQRTSTVLPLVRGLFEQHGLPRELHSDTGAPFGSTGFGRLSALSLFVLEQGVLPVFSRPGKPQDNGAHERMHRDLKAETTRPPGANMKHQQELFEAFRECYNVERPHQALDGLSPAMLWQPSERKFTLTPAPYRYPPHWERRPIDRSGKLTIEGMSIFVANNLRGMMLGLEPMDEGLWKLHLATLFIGMLSTRDRKLELFNREGQSRKITLSAM